MGARNRTLFCSVGRCKLRSLSDQSFGDSGFTLPLRGCCARIVARAHSACRVTSVSKPRFSPNTLPRWVRTSRSRFHV